MKIKTEKKLEVITVGEDTGVLEAGIDENSLPFLFEMMTEGLYSDPIGSMVREITSNCFDAHKEADVDDAVIIDIRYNSEDALWRIEFRDVGIGMSDERIAKIYSNYFSSTKRDTNELIGAFGLGSKTPLAYQDLFYITTVHKGIKYSCTYSKGETIPILDSDYGFREEIITRFIRDKNRENISEEELDIENEIYPVTHIELDTIVNKYPIGVETTERDGTIIEVDIKENDLYLFKEKIKKETCYFDNVYYGSICDIDNDYKIYEGKYFKYRNTFQYSEEMHILLGNVAYPIDFKQIGIKPIKIPVGVKFEIGELQVTPNRESIRYSEERNKLINERINNCIDELVEKHRADNSGITDIIEYIERRSEKTYVRLGGDKLYIPVELGIDKNNRFLSTEIEPPNDPFFMYKVHGEIDGEKIVYRGSAIVDYIKGDDRIFVASGKNFGIYKNAYINTGVVISRKKYNYDQLCSMFYLYSFGKTTSMQRYNNPAHLRRFDLDKNGRKKVPILGKAKLIKQYLDYIDKYIKDIAYDYDNHEVDETWVQEYKLQKKQDSPAYLRKLQGKITYRDKDGHRDEIKILTLATKKLVIYKMYKEEVDLRELLTLIACRKSLNKLISKGMIKFIEVSKTEYNKIKNLKNLIHYNDVSLHPMFRRMFRDYFTCILLKDQWYVGYRLEGDIAIVSTYYASLVKKINQFLRDNNYNSAVISRNERYITQIAKFRKSANTLILQIARELDKVEKKMQVHIFCQSMPLEFRKLLCHRLKITKLNEELYTIK